MADRRPIVTPGHLAELQDADRAVVSGLVRTLAGSLTLEDGVSGSKTLAQLVAAGSAVSSAAADTTPLITWTQSGTNGGSMRVTIGTRDPTSNVTGDPGDWYIRKSTTTSTLYVHRGATSSNNGWVDTISSSGIGGTTPASANRFVRSTGVANTIDAAATATIDNSSNVAGLGTVSCGAITATGTLTVNGASSSSSDPAAIIGHNGGTNQRLVLFGRTTTPQGNASHNPSNGQGVCVDASGFVYVYTGGTTGTAEWYRQGSPYSINGFKLTWTDANNLNVGAGYLTDDKGRLHAKITGTNLTTASGLEAPGSLDTGTMTASRWYYVWMIRNNAGLYSFVFSLSNTAPTLSHANFTGTSYAAIARVGSFRTSTVAATVIEFYQSGLFNIRKYVNDAASSEMYALNGGTSTSQTTIGHSAGGGALPVTAVEAKITVDTNGSSAVDISYSTSKTANPVGRVPISSGYFPITVPLLNGTFTYDNVSGSGSTIIIVHEYTEEVPFV